MLTELEYRCNFPLSAYRTIASLNSRAHEDRQPEHRIAFKGEARLQAGEGFRAESEDQEPRAISADVSRVDQAAGQILVPRSEGAFLATAVAESFGMESAVREMVHRRENQSFRELPGSTSPHPPPEQSSHFVGRGTG